MADTIHINDPDLIRRIRRQQAKRGHGTAARTAGQLLLERLYQIEEMPTLTGDDTAERDEHGGG